MKYVLTNAQMREADEYTIKTLGVPSLVLMTRAGTALYKTAREMLDGIENARVLCVCGGGNNGGDGFVCALRLLTEGIPTDAVFFATKSTAENDAPRKAFLIKGGKILPEVPYAKYDLVIDCLFGTGFHGEPSGEYARAIVGMNALRALGAKILSADIPSGVNGDNGKGSVAVQADKTLCFGELKAGVLLGDGIDLAGEVICKDIGITLPNTPETYARLSECGEIAALLPKRKRNSHKGTYGKAAIVAGSERYTGAAYLATAGELAMSACLRSGAGYTALFTPKDLLSQYMLKCPEALLVPLNEGGRVAFTEENFEKLLGYDSIAYGMGTGVFEDVANGAKYLLANFTGRLILDADALNSLAEYEREDLPQIFANKKCDVVLTPHCKEFSRLCGEGVQNVLSQGLNAPKEFAKTHKIAVLLKNAVSLITDGTKTFVNATGTAGQAKGGSGDVLAGVIAGLCAGGLSAFDGARAGAYLVGKAAELATKEIGEYSLVASDVIAFLGKAFLFLREAQE